MIYDDAASPKSVLDLRHDLQVKRVKKILRLYCNTVQNCNIAVTFVSQTKYDNILWISGENNPHN